MAKIKGNEAIFFENSPRAYKDLILVKKIQNYFMLMYSTLKHTADKVLGRGPIILYIYNKSVSPKIIKHISSA
jgi:hypothetical protein